MTEVEKAIKQVSKELQLPEEVVTEAYKSFWKCIKNHLDNLDLKKDISEAEFNKITTNFNIPFIGKLGCDYDRYCKIRKKYK